MSFRGAGIRPRRENSSIDVRGVKVGKEVKAMDDRVPRKLIC